MKIPISRFTITDKVLVAELSSFGRGPVMEPIYPERRGLPQRRGISVLGRTGEVVYYLAEERMQDGDLFAYVLKPTRESLAVVPGAADTEVHLLND